MSPILGIFASAQQSALLANSYESIATVSAGGTSTASFTSIPSTYKHLQIRAIQREVNNTGGDYPYIRFNSDTGTNYVYHRLTGNGTTASAGWPGSADTLMRYGYNLADANYAANVYSGVIIDILDYQNTNKYKTMRALDGTNDNTSLTYLNFESGLWMSTSAITRIDISPFSGNWDTYTTFALYGIKG